MTEIIRYKQNKIDKLIVCVAGIVLGFNIASRFVHISPKLYVAIQIGALLCLILSLVDLARCKSIPQEKFHLHVFILGGIFILTFAV